MSTQASLNALSAFVCVALQVAAESYMCKSSETRCEHHLVRAARSGPIDEGHMLQGMG